jgi:hypothetical protein
MRNGNQILKKTIPVPSNGTGLFFNHSGSGFSKSGTINLFVPEYAGIQP